MSTSDLLCLDFHRRMKSPQLPELRHISTQLNVTAWADALDPHPDRAFACYICCGLRYGFWIGCASSVCLKSASANMGSAIDHPEVVSEYIAKELALGRMVGPLASSAGLQGLHISRFGVIPKGHDTGRWRLITDLSYPRGHSVNDSIDPALCSLSYTTVNEIAVPTLQHSLGAGPYWPKWTLSQPIG